MARVSLVKLHRDEWHWRKFIIGLGNGFLSSGIYIHITVWCNKVTISWIYILEIDGLVKDNSNCIADAFGVTAALHQVMDVLNKLLILRINMALIKWVYPQILSTHNKQQCIH